MLMAQKHGRCQPFRAQFDNDQEIPNSSRLTLERLSFLHHKALRNSRRPFLPAETCLLAPTGNHIKSALFLLQVRGQGHSLLYPDFVSGLVVEYEWFSCKMACGAPTVVPRVAIPTKSGDIRSLAKAVADRPESFGAKCWSLSHGPFRSRYSDVYSGYDGICMSRITGLMSGHTQTFPPTDRLNSGKTESAM